MPAFRIHAPAPAPDKSRTILEQARLALGFVPNLYGMMAESPTLLKAYTRLTAIFDQSTLLPVERQVVLLSVSFENGCDYCMAAHTAIAALQDVPPPVVAAVREGRAIPDRKLQALNSFTRKVVERRGWIGDEDLRELLDAGYSRENVLEVILGVGLKTMSNYANHLAKTPLDEVFAAHAWTRKAS